MNRYVRIARLQVGTVSLVLLLGSAFCHADQSAAKQILEDPGLFSRDTVQAIRERSKRLAREHSSAIRAVPVANGPSLTTIEERYGKSTSTIESMPVPPSNQPLTIHWYGKLGLATPQGDERRPVVALFVEGPTELP